ncbi:perosamine synthetase [Candidatus Omnitrophus magneticus]|uniref:GDP-perosamine synthase n=1 Tax=Candidatus Omnitrophus magneticus TaxID=1609969 RepID=A0A0F0CSF5_9BACT|nr:perosamine synthetase [Candidatus Omnitrophus magneticus]
MSKKIEKLIPLSEPSVSGNEWKYIKECLDTGWVSSSGKYVDKFEEIVKSYLGTRYAVAVVNGTSALHLALLASGVLSGDEVIVPALTFIAPVNAVKYVNAYPVFMDADKDTFCVDAGKTCDFLKNECLRRQDGFLYNKKTARRIKAFIPVHIFGHPAEMDELLDICAENKIELIEDATESLGSSYKGLKTGAFGVSGCLSFNGNKIITTGGGGMVVTNDKYIADKVRHLSTQAKLNPFEYAHDEIGYNYRLTNIQSAMGVAQMEKLEEFITIKRKNAELYRRLLKDNPVTRDKIEFVWETKDVKSNFWFYTIKSAVSHKKPLMDFLLNANIQVRPVWQLMHTLPMYKECETYKIESASVLYETAINIPCSVTLKEDEINYIVEKIAEYFSVK